MSKSKRIEAALASLEAALSQHAEHEVSAMATPNLRVLNKVIQRGQITAEEVVGAVSEALKLRRMNPSLAEKIAEQLEEVFGIGETIDISARSVSAAKKLPDIKPGDTVRLTGKFLRSTGQQAGGEGRKRWKVKKVEKVGHSAFAVVDEKKDADELVYFTEEELKKDPSLRFRRINIFNLEKVKGASNG